VRLFLDEKDRLALHPAVEHLEVRPARERLIRVRRNPADPPGLSNRTSRRDCEAAVPLGDSFPRSARARTGSRDARLIIIGGPWCRSPYVQAGPLAITDDKKQYQLLRPWISSGCWNMLFK
jgi:hypothetical protein